MPLLKEFRILLPMTVEEYQVGQLFSVAEASKEVTGGGDGVEVLENAPYTRMVKDRSGNMVEESGQFTHKIYHLEQKVPRFIRAVAPTGSLEVTEKAHNAYPYCCTVITNPKYMKNDFELRIETWHIQDNGQSENVHNLSPEQLKLREVVEIDIANDPISSSDYKAEEDPSKFHSEKTGRGPLGRTWKETQKPLMCAYKLVYFKFKWWPIQGKLEKFVMNQEKRLFFLFHRQVFCWIDKYHGMTMEDIRAIEDKTKDDLDRERRSGKAKGFSASEAKEEEK